MSEYKDAPKTAGDSEVLIVFARHGETEWNKIRRIQGRGCNPGLNDAGFEQARALGEKLKGHTFAKIVASTRKRAIETAGEVKKHHPDVPYHEHPGLDECSFGEGEGKFYADVQLQVTSIYQKWWKGDRAAKYPGGESADDVIQRGMDALHEIVADTAPGSTVFVASHGLIRRFLEAEIDFAGKLECIKDVPHAENCSFVHFRYCKNTRAITQDATGKKGFGDLDDGGDNSKI